ncbi:MAG: SPASM domain-containing protein [Candidatus Nanohaloarchaeota archaeon QJJ-9]|nr:SPASM domain-containing protein [Candidatus Nanohaloarchaeota archaeon QJJ-9]
MNREKYNEENSKLGKSFLQKTFFSTWKNKEKKRNWNDIELIFDSECNLNCKYCYLERFGDKLAPKEDPKKEKENAEKVIDWLAENNYNPRINIFGGETLVKDHVYEVLDYILEKFKDIEQKPPSIVIPTNYTWIKEDERVEKIEKLIKKSRKIGIPIHLSTSIDGKYCDKNRPGVYRDEQYYEKIFEFNKKWGFGFHPMIYSNKIEDWKKNWEWFTDKLDKHGMDIDKIYLLEVRNQEWNTEEIQEMGEFIQYLIEWVYDYFGRDKEEYIDFLYDDGLNILRNPFTKNGRGIGCSIQSTFFVRLGDLKLVPCHRMSYEQFNFGKLISDGGKIADIEITNPKFLIGHKTMEMANNPQCSRCTIQELCTGGCLGSQYETTGDPFSPIPTVCQLEHEMLVSMIEKYEELGLLEKILNKTNVKIQKSVEDLKNIKKEV